MNDELKFRWKDSSIIKLQKEFNEAVDLLRELYENIAGNDDILTKIGSFLERAKKKHREGPFKGFGGLQRKLIKYQRINKERIESIKLLHRLYANIIGNGNILTDIDSFLDRNKKDE